jgi:uncharacterized protein (TIGR02246 family)
VARLLVAVLAVWLASAAGAAAQATDPAAVAIAFETALNAGDADALLALFADDAVITTQTTTAAGREQVRAFLRGLVAARFRVESVADRRVAGATETHTALVSTEDWKRLGIAPLEATAEVVVRDGKIASFAVTYTPASLAKLRAATARAAPAQLPRSGGPTTPLGAAAGLGAGLTLLGVALGRRRRSRCDARAPRRRGAPPPSQ